MSDIITLGALLFAGVGAAGWLVMAAVLYIVANQPQP